MEIKTDSSGNTIVPIVRGHLAIPTSKKKYRIFDTITLSLAKREFAYLDNLVKEIGSKDDIIDLINSLLLAKEFPDVVYKKIKSEFPDYFDRADFFIIDMVEKLNNNTINVYLDCLEELMHVKIDTKE